jgi:DNA-binding transcriptional LysR family regulator
VLAVAESLLHPIAAAAVAALLAASPAAQVTLRELGPEQQLAAVRGGAVDVGVLYLPVPADAGLVVETVRREAALVALPRGHRLGQRRRLHLRDLHGERAVGVERSQHPALYDAAGAALAGHGVRLDVVQEVSGKQAVLALVAAGVGLAVVPEGARALPVRRVTYRPLVAPGFDLEVALVWRADRRADTLHALVAALRRAATRAAP